MSLLRGTEPEASDVAQQKDEQVDRHVGSQFLQNAHYFQEGMYFALSKTTEDEGSPNQTALVVVLDTTRARQEHGQL
jgi:hypothetical protein